MAEWTADELIHQAYQLCPICCEYELYKPGSWHNKNLVITCLECKALLPIPPQCFKIQVELDRCVHMGDKYRVDMRRPR